MLLVQKCIFCHKIRPVICYLTYFCRVERSSKYVSSTWQVFYWSRSVLIKRFCLVFVGRSSFVTIFCSLVNFPLWPCSVIRSPGTSVWGKLRWCIVLEHGWNIKMMKNALDKYWFPPLFCNLGWLLWRRRGWRHVGYF